jgi:hypothetical protein
VQCSFPSLKQFCLQGLEDGQRAVQPCDYSKYMHHLTTELYKIVLFHRIVVFASAGFKF